jgi:predicted phage terminase large subunit-like protein
MQDSEWILIYEKAIRDDGSLFFPERLDHKFLDRAKRTMGSYLFANQYQNEIVPAEEATFKPEWIRYYKNLPTKKHTFAFVDPAISEAATSDFTALTIIDVDVDQNWYLRVAQRFKINATKIVDLFFRVNAQFKPQVIGVEDVAFQKALLHMTSEEMRRRGQIIPVTGIHPGTDKTKEMRIMSLVPRFEWGRILLSQGLVDFEMELTQFPRSAHDDLLDSLSLMDQIVYYPQPERKDPDAKPHPSTAEYEKQYISNLYKRSKEEDIDD